MAPPASRPAKGINKAPPLPEPSGYSYKRKLAPPKPKESKTARLKEYGLDLPDIPGVPIQVIPLQLNALKVATKFFKEDATAKAAAIPPYEVQVNSETSADASTIAVSTGSSSSSLSVMESIMNRLEKSTAALPPEEERLSQERTKRKKEALDSWLEAIHRCVRDQRQYQARQQQNSNNDGDDGKNRFGGGGGKTCVPLAALQHLWDIGQSHKRLTVRRAALHCCGHLLEKSSDCRRWLFQEGTFLVDWMDALAAATTLASSTSASRSTAAITDQDVPGEAASTGTRIRFWQREALLLLQHFVEQGYGDLYPTLTVALLRLKQTCPMVSVSDVDASSAAGGTTTMNSDRVHTMADWRRLRDVALQYAEQEEACVHKLIQRAQACMDILVPRLGVVVEPAPTQSSKAAVTATTAISDDSGKDKRKEEKDDGDNDDDDDEDIDWEDGFDEDDGIPEEENDNEPELHAAAVERTLAAIETTAGLQSGALEIDFDRQDEAGDTATNKEDHALSEPAVLLARTRLIKCVGILFDRHMPRLAAWVEGLTCADGLVLQQKDGAASCFVTMSQDQAYRRKDVLGALLEVKSTVASILQSAQRLGIQEATTATTADSREQGSSSNNTTSMTDQPAARRHPLVAVNLASSTTRHEGLETSFQRRRRLAPDSDVSRSRSNRIQIKYRKT
jgi:hypothetical protein